MDVIASQLRQVLGWTLLGWNLAIAPGISAPIPGQAYCPAQFRQDVATLLEEPEAAAAQWGILIRSQADGSVLLAHQANKAFIPASNQKLLTTGVALTLLGPEFRFETPVYGRLDRQNPTRLSQLQLMASGDPSLQMSDLQAIAKQLRQRGITQIGQVQLVDEIPPQEQYRPSWEWDDLLYYYAPPVSRAILADNQVALTLTPQSVEEPLAVSWSDETAGQQWQLLNQTRTVLEPQEPIRLLRQGITQQLLLTGELAPQSEPNVTTLAIPAPREYFLVKLREALSQQGISVEATQLVSIAAPLTSSPLFTLTSPPLQELSQTINQDSDNLYAEAVFNQLKRLTITDGETEALTPIQQQLADWQIDISSLRIRDGSGLSRQNLLSPRFLIELLDILHRSPQRQAFYDSLAIAGETGTLQKRFVDTPVAGKLRGKTGTLTGVSSLAGYISSTPLGDLSFSILVNNSPRKSTDLRKIIDLLLTWTVQVESCDEPVSLRPSAG